MTSPRFTVICGSRRPGWVAFCDADGLCAFDWLWVGDEVIVGYDDGADPLVLERIPVVDADTAVFARTPEAFAAFLAGRYSNPSAIEALHGLWDAERDRFHRAFRRRMRRRLLRMWLRRCIRSAPTRGALYQAHLRAELNKDLGAIGHEPVKDHAEIEGAPWDR